MFFRRAIPAVATFSTQMESLRKRGFTVGARDGAIVRASRDGCAIDMREQSGVGQPVTRAGILMGSEIGVLVDGGYQKFFRTPSGKQKPALAEELKALHEFEDDLRESLGQESLYNEALGTTSAQYMYDRVKDRDAGVPKRVWE